MCNRDSLAPSTNWAKDDDAIVGELKSSHREHREQVSTPFETPDNDRVLDTVSMTMPSSSSRVSGAG
jgi:hypothetical protein